MDIEGEIKFFKGPESFRSWLEKNHQNKSQLWVGYYKKDSGRKSIDWPQSVDQALCFGWIDGIRKSLDEISYRVRFTPRKKRSHWSKVNIKRVQELQKQGLMTEFGLSAFRERDKKNEAKATHEQKEVVLDASYLSQLKGNELAMKNFERRPGGYQKQCFWWIMSAKREETRQKRLEILIKSSEKDEIIPPLRWSKYK